MIELRTIRGRGFTPDRVAAVYVISAFDIAAQFAGHHSCLYGMVPP